MNKEELLLTLEDDFKNSDDVYIHASKDKNDYISSLKLSIKESICEPIEVKAKIMEPGFPNKENGSIINGTCIATSKGYWLVYQPQEKQFYCFWGADINNLGAHGVYGSALYCWSA